MTDYVPIACSVHDQLEALAVRRERVRVEYRGADGTEREIHGAIVDIWTEAGAEYLRTDSGTTVRLDHLRAVVSRDGRIELGPSG